VTSKFLRNKEMNKTTQKLVRAMTILTTLGSLATVGIGLYRALKEDKRFKKVDTKLDERLDQSMDCSDATAVY
jgi:hypothetical protein